MDNMQINKGSDIGYDITNDQIDLLPDEPLKAKLLRNGFWSYLFTFLVAPTGYIIKVVAAGSMSVGDIGLFYSILGIVGIISSYNDFGLTEALQYFLPHYYIKKEYIKAKSLIIGARLMQFLSGFVIGGILWLGAPWLAEHYFHSVNTIPVLRIFSIYFLFLNLFQVLQSIFLATQNTKVSYGIDTLRMWIVVISFIVIWQVDPSKISMTTMALSWLGGYVIAICLGLKLFRKKYGRIIKDYPIQHDYALYKKRLGFALRVFLGANVSTIFSQIDQQFALYFLGPESAGQRTVYLSLMNISTFLTSPLSTYLFPLVTELSHKNQQKKMKLLFVMILWGLIALALIMRVFLHYFGPQITVLLFGEKFRASGEILAFAAPYLIFGPAVGFAFQFLGGSGQAKLRVYILGIGLIINIICNLILLPLYGLYGLVIGIAISYGVMGIIAGYKIYRKTLHLA